jgi:ribokinase
MREVRILVVGSSVLDNVIRVKKFPEPGESVRASNVQTFMGGKGSNQAVAAARLGANTTFAGAVGNDPSGHELVLRMRQEQIDCKSVIFLDNVGSGNAFITLNHDGQNTIAVSLGANMAYEASDAFNAAHQNLHDILLLQGEIPIEASCAAAESSQGLVILNPAPPLSIPRSMFPLVDFLTPNEHEAEALTTLTVDSMSSAQDAASSLLETGCRNVVITLGSKGAYYANNETSGFVKAPRVNVVDTVGAGDCFNGSFAFAVSHGVDIENATRFAVACASISVTEMGAQTGMPYWDSLPEEVKGYLQIRQSA